MKRMIGVVIGVLLGLGAAASQASAAILVAGTDNDVFFVNFENLYDSTGNFKSVTSLPAKGDYLAGIISANGIRANSVDTNFDSSTFQLSGIFAQKIEDISFHSGVLPHLTLGTPTITTFCKGADCFDTGLAAGEMFRFYIQQSPDPVTTFESNGSLADDKAKATDGTLWLSLGLADPGAGVDPGFAYSHLGLFPLGFPPVPGIAFAGLNTIVNNTGYDFAGVNDVNESEIGGTTLLNHLVYVSRFDYNPDGSLGTATSPWEFRSNDPARVHPNVIPEVSSLWMLGMGLSGFGFIRRKKLIA